MWREALHKGRDTLTPLPFVVIWDMFWQRRSASYFVNIMFTLDLMITKYEADLLCQNITYINTKGIGGRVSHPVFTSLTKICDWHMLQTQ